MGIDHRKPAPLYKQIVQDIRDKVLSGHLPVGAPVGSHQELAREYGVSLITVKKALGELIRDGVLFSRVGKGTYVARRPAEFAVSKNKAIGIVLRDVTSPFFSLIVKGVENAASMHGFNILLSSTANVAEKEDNQIRHFVDMGVSGLVIASMTHVYSASEILRKIHKQGFPYVMVSYLSDLDIYRVGTDHRRGARIATDHLIKLGYSRVGYVNGEEGNRAGEERRIGYEQSLTAHGLQVDPRLQFRLRLRGEWHDYQSGYEIGEQFRSLRVKPEAFFVYDDLAALGLQQALLNAGIRVPEDVGIVGFDDIGRAQYAPVPLTTVHQPTFEIGTTAVEILLKRIAGENAPVLTILQPTLVVRASCGAALRAGRISSAGDHLPLANV